MHRPLEEISAQISALMIEAMMALRSRHKKVDSLAVETWFNQTEQAAYPPKFQIYSSFCKFVFRKDSLGECIEALEDKISPNEEARLRKQAAELTLKADNLAKVNS